MNFIFLCFFTIIITSCSDDVENYYKDFNSLKISDSFKKGWIPNFVPESAYEINEKHELDNNQVWLSFKCKISDIKQVIEKKDLVDANKKMVDYLRQYFDIIDAASFYKLSDNEFIAIDKARNRICYYRTKY